jgi:hypothetical protein
VVTKPTASSPASPPATTVADWSCPHGFGPGAERGDCEACNAEIAEEVRSLLHDPSAYRMDDIHKRLEQLVGRPVWTHEFVTATRLIEEARGALPHPEDLNQHAIESLQAVAGDKPIIVVKDGRIT